MALIFSKTPQSSINSAKTLEDSYFFSKVESATSDFELMHLLSKAKEHFSGIKFGDVLKAQDSNRETLKNKVI